VTDFSCLGIAFVSSVISATVAGAATFGYCKRVVSQRVRQQIFNETEMLIQHRREKNG
jgi:hypothetical protein